jgi:hypothetical protein
MSREVVVGLLLGAFVYVFQGIIKDSLTGEK